MTTLSGPIAIAIRMLQEEAASRGRTWNVGDKVFVNVASGVREDSNGMRVYEESGGLAMWPNHDISYHSFDTVEAAMKFIAESGGDGVSDDLCSYYIEY